MGLGSIRNIKSKVILSQAEAQGLKENYQNTLQSVLRTSKRDHQNVISTMSSLQLIRSHIKTLEVIYHTKRADIERELPPELDHQQLDPPHESEQMAMLAHATVNTPKDSISKLPEDDFFIGEHNQTNVKDAG
jgi:hypothetical protein